MTRAEVSRSLRALPSAQLEAMIRGAIAAKSLHQPCELADGGAQIVKEVALELTLVLRIALARIEAERGRTRPCP